MRRPPSLKLVPAYPVAAGVGLMALAVTFMTLTERWPLERFQIGPTAFHHEPWRLVTAALPHLDPPHLVFDVYWLWVFGTALEDVFGHVRLLALVAILAAASSAAEYAIVGPGVGLSGVGFGLFGVLWVLSARDRRFAGVVDGYTAQLFGFWFVLCLVLTQRKLWNVANVAHAAGASLGVLVGLAMTARRPARRIAAAIGMLVLLVASLAGATVLRPRVNLRHDGYGSSRLGYDAIQAGRFDDAIRHYLDSLAMNDKNAIAWYNLGNAYEHAGRKSDALAAYRRALELEPNDTQHRSAFVRSSFVVAVAAHREGEDARAIELLRRALEIDPDDGDAWRAIAKSYRALGRDAEAERARERAASSPPRRR